MRGKKAKRLRAIAQAMTAGLPWTSYIKAPDEKGGRLGQCGRAVYQEAKRDSSR
jgi:hypothetical protein